MRSSKRDGMEREMLKIPKQRNTPEFRTLTVQRVKDGKIISEVAREQGVSGQTLRTWAKSADVETLTDPRTEVARPEQMEMTRLKARNRRLPMELDIAKKAAAYLARDLL